MSSEPRARHAPADEDLVALASDFENREFGSDELSAIKKTRRGSPRLGEATAAVQTFRAPPSLMDRIKRRAASDCTTESQVIRDALEAYL